MKRRAIKRWTILSAAAAAMIPACIWAGHSHKTKTNIKGTLTGSVIDLTAPISIPTPTTPAGAVSLGDLKAKGKKTVTISSGVYSCTGVDIKSKATLCINAASGPVYLYCSGTFNCEGTITTTGNLPNNFHLYIVNSSPVTLAAGDYYGAIVAPASAVDLKQNVAMFGEVVGKTVTLAKDSSIHFDQALGSNGQMAGGISQVN